MGCASLTQPHLLHLRTLNPHVEAVAADASAVSAALGGGDGVAAALSIGRQLAPRPVMGGRRQKGEQPAPGRSATAVAAGRGASGGGIRAHEGLLAGISSFAFMGTNAHLVLQVSPPAAAAALKNTIPGEGSPPPSAGPTRLCLPWERSSFWVAPDTHLLARSFTASAVPTASVASLDTRLPPLHPSPSVALLQANLSAPQLAWLRDHIVGGQPVLPGAAYCEAALAAAGLLLLPPPRLGRLAANTAPAAAAGATSGASISQLLALTKAEIPSPLILPRVTTEKAGREAVDVLPLLQCEVNCATGAVTISSAQQGQTKQHGSKSSKKRSRSAVHFTGRVAVVTTMQSEDPCSGVSSPAVASPPLASPVKALLLVHLFGEVCNRMALLRAPTAPMAASASAAASAAAPQGVSAVAALAAPPHPMDGMMVGAHLLDSSLQLGQVFIMGGTASSASEPPANRPQGVYVPSGLEALLGPLRHSDGFGNVTDEALCHSVGGGGGTGRYISATPRPRSQDGPAIGSSGSDEANGDYALLGPSGGSPLLRISGLKARRMPLALLQQQQAPSRAAAVPRQRQGFGSKQDNTAASGSEQQLAYRVDWLVHEPEAVSQMLLADAGGRPRLVLTERSSGAVSSEVPCAAAQLANLLATVADLAAVSDRRPLAVGAAGGFGAGSMGNVADRDHPGGSALTVQSALLQGLLKTAAQEGPATTFSLRVSSEAAVGGGSGLCSLNVNDAAHGFSEGAVRGAAAVAFGAQVCGGAASVPRLVPELRVAAPLGPHHLVPRPKGSLDSLVPEPLPHWGQGTEPLSPGQVLLAVRAVGINFRDVLNVSLL